MSKPQWHPQLCMKQSKKTQSFDFLSVLDPAGAVCFKAMLKPYERMACRQGYGLIQFTGLTAWSR